MGKSREQIAWEAAQGVKASQLTYAKILRAEGRNDWADFFQDKADGKNPHFTLESYLAAKN